MAVWRDSHAFGADITGPGAIILDIRHTVAVADERCRRGIIIQSIAVNAVIRKGRPKLVRKQMTAFGVQSNVISEKPLLGRAGLFSARKVG